MLILALPSMERARAVKFEWLFFSANTIDFSSFSSWEYCQLWTLKARSFLLLYAWLLTSRPSKCLENWENLDVELFNFYLSPGLACCCYLAFLVQDCINLKEQPTFYFVKKYKHLSVFSATFPAKFVWQSRLQVCKVAQSPIGRELRLHTTPARN